jgi:hypothetical protein
VLDTRFPLGRLPGGYGLEAHLNLHILLMGGRVESVDVGRYTGPVRYPQVMYQEIGEAILDLAESHGRLGPDQRAQWEAWLQPILDVLAFPPPVAENARNDYRQRVLALAERPFPDRSPAR